MFINFHEIPSQEIKCVCAVGISTTSMLTKLVLFRGLRCIPVNNLLLLKMEFHWLILSLLEIAIEGCNISDLRTHDYRNYDYANLQNYYYTITCSNISTLSEISYQHHERGSVQQFEVVNSTITTIKPGELDKFSTIDKLYLRKLHIQQILPGAFSELSHLTELHLDGNQLSHVAKGVFNPLHELVILNLCDNKIHTVEQFAFKGLNSLLKLYLQNNNLTQVSSVQLTFDIPTDVPLYDDRQGSLMWQQVSSSIQESQILQTSAYSPILDLSFNAISDIGPECFEGLKMLNGLYLQNNDIRSLEHGLFRDLASLQVLNLSNNEIQSFRYGTFDSLDDLVLLDISHNNVLYLQRYIFHSLRSLKFLHLNNNNITSLDVEDFKFHLSSLKELTMDHNPWNCSDLVQMRKSLRSNNIQISNGGSYHVENVHGVPCVDGVLGVSSSKPFSDEEVERFFGEGFRETKFFQYFQKDYSQSEFFKYWNDYKFAANFDGKTEKHSAVDASPDQFHDTILTFGVIIQIVMCLTLFFIIYLIFKFFRMITSGTQSSSEIELC